jgi:hypothetical protein
MAELQTNGDFSDITLGAAKAVTQISNADPAIITLAASHGYVAGNFIYLADFDESLFPTILNDLPASHDFTGDDTEDGWTMLGSPATCETDADSKLTVVVDTVGQGINVALDIVEGTIYRMSVPFTITDKESGNEWVALWSENDNIEFLFGTSDNIYVNRNGDTCFIFSGNGTKVLYFKALDTVIGETLVIDCDKVTNGFTFTLDNPLIQEVANLDGNVYELGTFTGDTAPLSNYAGDLDLSGLAGVTSAGNAKLVTLTDWTVGDGVGPFRNVGVKNSIDLPVSHDFLVAGDTGGWKVEESPTVCETDADGKLSFTPSASWDGIWTKVYMTPMDTHQRISFDFTMSNANDGELVFAFWDGGFEITSVAGTGVTLSGNTVILTESTRVTIDCNSPFFGTWTPFKFLAFGYVDGFSFTIANFVTEIIYDLTVQVTGSQSAETSLLQDVAEVNGKKYKISFGVSDRTAGGAAPTAGGDDGTEQIANGSYSEVLTAVGPDNSGLKFSDGFIGKVDDLLIESFAGAAMLLGF